VSKRELYTLVGNRQKMLITAIGKRAKRLHAPRRHADAARPRGAGPVVEGVRDPTRARSHPGVVAVVRLAIAEAVHASEVARTLDSLGRETSRAALRHVMSESRTVGLIDGRQGDFLAGSVSGRWPRCRPLE
jgi:hypothetical protein